MLKVKDYIKKKKKESIDEKLTEAFIEFIEGKTFVKYYSSFGASSTPVSFLTKLKTDLLSLEAPYPLKEIYEELTELCFDKNLNHIGFHKFHISPVIINTEHKGEVRGIIAQIKYVA